MLHVAPMRVLAVAALVLCALVAPALAQPGMTQPSPPPTGYYPPPQPYYAPQQQPYLQQPELQLKSSSTATLLSLGTTALGLLGIAAAFEERSEGLLVGGIALTLVGPSAGHIYAGENGHAVKLSLVRGGGFLIFMLGALEADSEPACYDYYACAEDDEDGETAMLVGGAIVVVGTLYDLYDAGRAARRYNEKARARANVMFAPTMMSKAGGGVTPGVGLAGTF